MATALQGDADMEHLFMTRPSCAHQHSAGAKKQQQELAVHGRTDHQLHVAVDALGNPLRIILSAGQLPISKATALIGISPSNLLWNDKVRLGAFVTAITNQGSQAVIPPRPTDSTRARSTAISTRAAI
ncbi:MAG: hypothetical protein HS120_10345 [Burkholderiales bacterium]|nr:hypothetical protein [Burkholderiales bacterium]